MQQGRAPPRLWPEQELKGLNQEQIRNLRLREHDKGWNHPKVYAAQRGYMRHYVAKNVKFLWLVYLCGRSLANVHAQEQCDGQAGRKAINSKSPDNVRVIRAAIQVGRPEDGAS